MMRYFIPLGLLVLLTSCATTTPNYYTETVQSWRQSNINEVIQRWGTPNSQVVGPHGNTIYTYKTIGYREYSPSPAPVVGLGFSAGRPVTVTQPSVSNAASRSMSLSCITAFVTNPQGTVVSVQSQGNGCYGNEKFAKARGKGSITSPK